MPTPRERTCPRCRRYYNRRFCQTNKEIADKLTITLNTVISHRKNIMDKLGMKSVSALTIYAVMHGYVDINKI